ncbi:AraC family transcriptional regulator (plasmid) [Persicobacter psychrovividus]|uniref:AraC family transcriptional regulator n=2 Tax=Persicobacter psychrovividus TaxID=387638 RepID=A0ABM7VKT8_9BACT|nr:AraC family transcriptional regulator [Persicobacter psychrovividus]
METVHDFESVAFNPCDFLNFIPIHALTNKAFNDQHLSDHGGYFIVLLQDVSGSITVDLQEVSTQGPLLFLLGPDNHYNFEIAENAKVNGFILNFDEVLFSLCNLPEEYRSFFNDWSVESNYSLDSNEFNYLNNMLANLSTEVELFCREPYHDNMIVRMVEQLMIFAYRKETNKNSWRLKAEDAYVCRYRSFLELLDAQYKQWHLVGDYTEHLQMHEKQLNRACKRVANKSALQIIHHRLLLQAKRLLVSSNSSIKDIAFELGFADPAHFSKFFKKKTGAWPVEFRQGVEALMEA